MHQQIHTIYIKSQSNHILALWYVFQW